MRKELSQSAKWYLTRESKARITNKGEKQEAFH